MHAANEFITQEEYKGIESSMREAQERCQCALREVDTLEKLSNHMAASKSSATPHSFDQDQREHETYRFWAMWRRDQTSKCAVLHTRVFHLPIMST